MDDLRLQLMTDSILRVEREIDLSELGSAYQGKKLSCWVNFPGNQDDLADRHYKLNGGEFQRLDHARWVVATALGLDLEKVKQFPDDRVIFLVDKITDAIEAYRNEVKKI